MGVLNFEEKSNGILELPDEHLKACLKSLCISKNEAYCNYKFFQELNETCLMLKKIYLSIDKVSNNFKIAQTVDSEITSSLIDIDVNKNERVSNIKLLTGKLLNILCSHSKELNHSILKMVGTTLINSLSLLCREEIIVQNVIDILELDEKILHVNMEWESTDNNSKYVMEVEILDMVSSKIALAAAICEHNWWHIPKYNYLVTQILSTTSVFCCNKFLHHLTFAFQTLKSCLDHTSKQTDFHIEESLLSKLFQVVLGNWENYIPSVMELNLMLFESFLKCLMKKDLEANKKKTWQFLTNVSCTLKSKYYTMATCFLADFYHEEIFSESWFMENMTYSLSRSYLVTAGAYCHKVLTKNIFIEEKWKSIFLEKVVELVCHTDICIRQNVCNYWLPTAIKHFPDIIPILYDRTLARYNLALKQCSSSDVLYCKNRSIDQLQRHLHSVILIVKLERPAKFDCASYKCIQEGLSCSNEMIRGDAFLCCQSFNGVKCHVEMDGDGSNGCQIFRDVFGFLKENINCDDANLRQVMYKVFKNYVRNTEGQIHKCVVPIDLVIRHKGGTEPFQMPEYMDNYIQQYNILYTFFMKNLTEGSNYQRLITTLNLLNILFENMQTHMTENQKKKRKPTIEYLKENNKWSFESSECRERLFSCLKEETNDVRFMAKLILQSYFTYLSEEFDTFVTNVQNSVKMSQSNVFYTAESGAYGVAVMTHLFYKSNFNRIVSSGFLTDIINSSQTDKIRNVCDNLKSLEISKDLSSVHRNIFATHFLDQCLLQSASLQKDILSAVKNENALHGSLTTLMLIITDPSSPEFCGLNPDQVQSLLNLLNETCLYLLDILCMKSKSTNFAPSFGEMGEAMNSLISSGDAEHLTLTPAHQTLFNCIWMNLKICCTFASELAVAYRDKLTREQIVFSCGIVSHVLHKCRHKGAIQNAGLALGNIVSKCLYHDAYPLELLQYTLTSTLDCTVGGTVSRKSAGVAILVHKLLASNHSMKHVLFTTAMDKIIQVANSPVLLSEETLKVDLPQAVAFHMLQFLVADAGLRIAMAAYLEDITKLCFEKMQCQEWTVRNAALQVFGALLPKLVGTKKQDSENQISNVAFEEFFYQLPRIGDCLKSVLTSLHDCNTSVLVSALTLLSRLKTTGDLLPSEQIIDLRKFLREVYSTLLSSNIYTIRFLVANCYVNTLHLHSELHEQFDSLLLSCLEHIFGSQVLMENFNSPNVKSFLQMKSRRVIANENHLHGSLLTLENLKDRLLLENLKLDHDFLLELLFFLTADIPCVVDIKFSTYSLLYKIFRHENELFGSKISSNINILDTISRLLNKDVKKEIGWKLYTQEVIKFHMSSCLFVGDNVDFNYIAHLIQTLRHESDILSNTLAYLSTVLENHSVKTNLDSIVEGNNSEQIAKARNQNSRAQNCIKRVLKTVCCSNISQIGLERIFNTVVQIYNIFVDDKEMKAISCFTTTDEESLNLGNRLLDNHCNGEKSIEYACPVTLPVAAICALFSCQDSPAIDELLTKISHLTNTFIYNEDCNEEFRYNAALSMCILCDHPRYRSLFVKDALTNAIHLLQDEVYEVRQEITYFVRNFQKCLSQSSSLYLTNPYTSLFNLLSANLTPFVDACVLLDVFSGLLFINDQDLELSPQDAEFSNPFDHNIRNFYSESIFVAEHVKTVCCELISTVTTRSVNASVLSELLAKCTTCIGKYSTNEKLNSLGNIKIRLLKDVAVCLENSIQNSKSSS